LDSELRFWDASLDHGWTRVHLAPGPQTWLATRRRAAPDTRQEDVEGVEVLEAHRDPALRFYSTLAAFPSAMAIKD